MSGGEGVVWVVCAPGTWGQWVRVRGQFFYCQGSVRARVRLVGWVRCISVDLRKVILVPTLACDNLQLKDQKGKPKIVPGSTHCGLERGIGALHQMVLG